MGRAAPILDVLTGALVHHKRDDIAQRAAVLSDERWIEQRAAAGGLGYGDVKKDLLARILETFGPMRERREALAARPDDVEDVLRAGAEKARALGAPVLAAAREAAGLGPA